MNDCTYPSDIYSYCVTIDNLGPRVERIKCAIERSREETEKRKVSETAPTTWKHIHLLTMYCSNPNRQWEQISRDPQHKQNLSEEKKGKFSGESIFIKLSLLFMIFLGSVLQLSPVTRVYGKNSRNSETQGKKGINKTSRVEETVHMQERERGCHCDFLAQSRLPQDVSIYEGWTPRRNL